MWSAPTSFSSVRKEGFTAHGVFHETLMIATGTSSTFLKLLMQASLTGEFFLIREGKNISLVRIRPVRSEKQIKEKKNHRFSHLNDLPK